MASIPAKIAARLSEGLKRFQPILDSAKIRDVNESDTVVIITGLLSEVLGFDKYSEVTTEHSIRGTYCDLALSVNGKVKLLIEAKAVGIELKENHVKQAVDYAANKGLEWVILTNGVIWRIYKVVFSKPINNILVAEIDLLKLNHKNTDNIELLYILTKEGILKSSLEDYHIQKQATNRFMIGNLLCTESVISLIRKELRQIYPDIKVQPEEIKTVLMNEVIKREILNSDESVEAKKKITRTIKKKEKGKQELAGIPLNTEIPAPSSTEIA